MRLRDSGWFHMKLGHKEILDCVYFDIIHQRDKYL